MIKLVCLIFLLLATSGDSLGFNRFRDCPAIDYKPQHFVPTGYNAAEVMKNVTVNLAAVAKNLAKWPKSNEHDGKYEVPYLFDKNFPSQMKEGVYFGMVMIERGSNVIFIEKGNTHKDYILLKRPLKDNICDSYTGNVRGRQVIRLASWCITPSTVIHELLHAIGLEHEHQRTDRQLSNTGKWIQGSNQSPDPNIKALTPYDPFSIMHYPMVSGTRLRAKDNWTKDDTLIARYERAMPTVCDYSAVNELYDGWVEPVPCTDVRLSPWLLEPTQEGERRWKTLAKNFKGHNLTWACNWISGSTFNSKSGNIELFNYARQKRKFCQFQDNSMYPSFWWMPYAEVITYPIAGLDYSKFHIFPTRARPNWMTHEICDCLGPPPPFDSTLVDHSMYQICLECVHFKDTTGDVLNCIAQRSQHPPTVLRYLRDSYNTTQYYLINPS